MTKDDAATENTPVAAPDNTSAPVSKSPDEVVDSIEDKAATAKANNDAFRRNGDVASNGLPAEDDSEAETDIEPGKEAGPRNAGRKSIKHEDKDASITGQDKSNGVSNRKKVDGNTESSEKTSGDNTNSSILTSIVSSPSQVDDQSSHAGSGSGSGSAASPHSPSKTSVDSDTLARNSAKRKRDNEDGQENEVKRRIKRETSPDGGRAAPAKKQRSMSPQPRQRRRTLSTVSTTQDQGSKPGRRKPAPIRTKDLDDDSDDSSGSQPQRPRKSASHSHNASTSRKMPPAINTFKYRDRNGRTLLAKACYTDSVDVVRERLEENPGHLDEREYADNTPLQIAALRGDAEIVKFLITRGASVHTQNSEKDTPLIDAVENCNFEVVTLLLNAGVNPSQPNAKGEEPLELIPEDEDDPEATESAKKIKGALMDAKEKWKSRRPSEPNDQQSSRRSAAAQSPRGSPSFNNLTRHSTESGSGRRAPRGASTRNDLLWITPTPQRLRKAAGEGDAEATSHILSMGAKADSQAVLAAAKGCHQACLELLLAMGNPEIDPDPIPGLKPGWDTPLLAAIGQSGDNIGIIQTLLGQVGFNPTRKLYQGKTYYGIARDRAGSNSQIEYDMLKQAYDNFVRKHGSPRSGRTAGTVKRSKRVDTDSPKTSKHAQLDRKDSEIKVKRQADSSVPRRKGSPERPSSSGSHLQVPAKHKSRESSVAISERAESPARREKKRRISSGSEEEKALPKQRKRLLTGKERREGEEQRKRRSSITSVDSASSALKRGSGNGEVKKSKIRSSVSPAREKKLNVERKPSDTTGTLKLKRQAKPEAQSATNSVTDKKPRDKIRNSTPDANNSRSVAPTAPMATSSMTDADLETKKRKREEDEAQRKEEEQKQREREAAERERKAEIERKAESERKEAERIRKEKEDEERAQKEKKDREERERREQEARELRRRKLDLERLPEGLFHAVHGFASPPTAEEQQMWTPLRAIQTQRLGLHCPDAKKHSDDSSTWLLNFQVATLLGLKDWALSEPEFKSWPRIPMRSYLASPAVGWFLSCFTQRKSLAEESELEYWARLKANRAKFVALADETAEKQYPLFWVRTEDFAQALDGYQHVRDTVKNEQGDLRVQLCTFPAKLKPPSGAEGSGVSAS